jgi:hypothetical protein
MDKEQLRVNLEQLHAELQQIDSVDDNEREMLQRLAKDIREIFDREDEHSKDYSGLRARLKDAVAKLEASHPKITLLMRELIDSLNYLGI